MKINILGTDYTVEFLTEKEEPALEGMSGFCDIATKRIVVYDFVNTDFPEASKEVDSKKYIQDLTLRHEILHAFLNESGLHDQSEWATNEEMVDYFALQFHKIEQIYNNLEI